MFESVNKLIVSYPSQKLIGCIDIEDDETYCDSCDLSVIAALKECCPF